MRGGEIGGTSCSCGRVSKECETRKVSGGWSGREEDEKGERTER